MLGAMHNAWQSSSLFVGIRYRGYNQRDSLRTTHTIPVHYFQPKHSTMRDKGETRFQVSLMEAKSCNKKICYNNRSLVHLRDLIKAETGSYVG